MAVRNDNDLPELVPFDDRLPSRADLFRRAEEISEDQFALLAAEWAEGESGADRIAEIEAIFAVSPERRALAEEFKKIRLVPGSEKWPGREAMIKSLPPSFYHNRIMYAVMASAAVLLAFLTLSPLLRNSISQNDPAMLPQINIAAAAMLPEAKIAAAAVKPARNPVPAPGKRTATVTQITVPAVSAPEKLQADAGHNPRIQPFDFRNGPETVRLIAGVSTAELTTVERMQVQTDIRSLPGEANWIMRGISALSGIVTGKDKPVDGYMIAGACVKGINSVLGWEMDLERVVSDEGNPLAVNFSSALLSFSTPAKKSTDEP